MSLAKLNIDKIVDTVIAMLVQRQQAVYQIKAQDLANGLSPSVFGRYSQLHISLPDLPFLYQLANYQLADSAAVKSVFEAMSYGISLQISVEQKLLTAFPVQGLQALPIEWVDQQGKTIVLNTANVISYSSVHALSDVWLIIDKKSLVTALAQEVITTGHIHLIKAE